MKLTGGQIIVKNLKRERVPYILGIPGHGVLGLFDAVREAEDKGEIKYIQVKHEQAAVHIADGYYRMTGRPLATLSSIGPGSLNTIIGLATAYVDSSAAISFCGDTHTNMKGVGVLQEIERYQDSNFIRTIEPVVKRCWRAESTEQLERIMPRAFAQMKSGRPGPVAIAVPMDVQADVCCVDNLEEVPAEPPTSKAYASVESIEKAITLMKKAKRPVLYVGGGALRSRSAELLVKLAEKWNCAVCTTLGAKSAFPEDHELYCYHTGSKGTPIGVEMCKNADVILALGTRFADESTSSYRYGSAFSFPTTKLIQVDLCAEEINKNYRADVGIVADINCVLEQLIEYYGEATERDEYKAEILERRNNWKKKIEDYRKVPEGEITISKLIGALQNTLTDDTVIVTSSGNTQAQLFQEYCFKKPYSCVTTGGFSTMGWSFPAAMGVKLACPDRPVVALMGDGDFLMTMQEMSTMVQYDIPVVIVLADNSGWFAIKDLQMAAYGDKYAFGNDFLKDGRPYSPDFAAVAEGFGVKGYTVTDETVLEKTIQEAVASGKPALVNVKVSRTYPYSGGETYGWWDVPTPPYIDDKRSSYEKGKSEEFKSL